MTERWKVTLTDGLGPDRAHLGTVLYMPYGWVYERLSAEICAFADEETGNPPGTAYLIPDLVKGTERAAIYDNGGMIAALLIAVDYSCSSPGLEVVTAKEAGTDKQFPRLSSFYPFPGFPV
jgi:hypothetical protein